VRGRIESFRELTTLPIAITPDGALSAAAFWASVTLPFPVLVDPDNHVAAAYGLLGPDSQIPRRATTVIDQGGVVLIHQTQCPHLDQLIAVLQGSVHGMTPILD
jgi:peroxiredoxin